MKHVTTYTEWTVVGEDADGEWIAELGEYTREEAEEYQREHGGRIVSRTVTEWEWDR